MIDPSFRPRLRPTLSARPDDAAGIEVYDPHRIGNSIGVSPAALEVLKHFDGNHSLERVAAAFNIPPAVLQNLAAVLEENLLLDSPRFQEHVRERTRAPVRAPSCIGSYPDDPNKLRTDLGKLFDSRGGPGRPAPDGSAPSGSPRLRAVLAPHMDYGRGNVTYGWAFKELVENTDATVFVIVATSHYSHHRFTLSRQHFATPLGVAETDLAYVDRIAAAYGPGLFDDELAHIPEHSIELEVVILQYLLENRRPFRIVPLLTGSYADCTESGTSPGSNDDIAKMVAALREAEAGCSENVCYLISGDLAHIGPKFGDEEPVAGPWLEASRKQDEAILAQLTTANPETYFRAIAEEQDARRICGLPPTWLALETIRPKRGRVLHYQQFVHPQGHESVSFAAAAFYE